MVVVVGVVVVVVAVEEVVVGSVGSKQNLIKRDLNTREIWL